MSNEIKNPLVVIIPIGGHPCDDFKNEAIEDCDFEDVPIDKDVKNLIQLFKIILNYKIFPVTDVNNVKDNWTENEIFLTHNELKVSRHNQ